MQKLEGAAAEALVTSAISGTLSTSRANRRPPAWKLSPPISTKKTHAYATISTARLGL